jgi:endonuclease/exonuclease/phosphatase family metal-dependent hydrolase
MAVTVEPATIAPVRPLASASMPGVVVASFNVHGGVDGLGRSFDVVAACRELDADLLVLQETWSPDAGEPLAHQVADALGYKVEELAMTRARLWPAPGGPAGWGPALVQRGPYGLRVGEAKPGRRPERSKLRGTGTVEHGTWGLAVLARVPLLSTALLDLGQLSRDPARRGAIAVEVDVEGRALRVIGTHLSHLSHGSVVQLRELRRQVDAPGTPAVLTGDMNMWGPPLSALLPGWTRIVRGRTWPAWRPVAQLDHILVTAGVRILEEGRVVSVPGSDHLPVRARVALA